MVPKAQAPRPSLRAVAQLAGVSVATASRVMNDHPQVSAAARTAVESAIKRLGYSPDPVLRALGQYRWPNGRKSSTPAIAYIVDHWTVKGPEKAAAMRQRVTGLGYRAEQHLLTPQTNISQIIKQCRARNVGGLIIDIHGDDIDLQCPWEQFSAVIMGEGLPDLALPRISSDWQRMVLQAEQALRHQGKKRIGFLIRSYAGRGLRDELHAAVHATMGVSPHRYPAQALKTVAIDHLRNQPEIAAWFRSYKPDAVIGDTPQQFDQLCLCGADIPRSCAFFSLLRGGEIRERHEISGFHIDLAARMRHAVDVLHGRLLHREVGIPDHPQRLLLHGEWRPGQTL